MNSKNVVNPEAKIKSLEQIIQMQDSFLKSQSKAQDKSFVRSNENVTFDLLTLWRNKVFELLTQLSSEKMIYTKEVQIHLDKLNKMEKKSKSEIKNLEYKLKEQELSINKKHLNNLNNLQTLEEEKTSLQNVNSVMREFLEQFIDKFESKFLSMSKKIETYKSRIIKLSKKTRQIRENNINLISFEKSNQNKFLRNISKILKLNLNLNSNSEVEIQIQKAISNLIGSNSDLKIKLDKLQSDFSSRQQQESIKIEEIMNNNLAMQKKLNDNSETIKIQNITLNKKILELETTLSNKKIESEGIITGLKQDNEILKSKNIILNEKISTFKEEYQKVATIEETLKSERNRWNNEKELYEEKLFKNKQLYDEGIKTKDNQIKELRKERSILLKSLEKQAKAINANESSEIVHSEKFIDKKKPEIIISPMAESKKAYPKTEIPPAGKEYKSISSDIKSNKTLITKLEGLEKLTQDLLREDLEKI